MKKTFLFLTFILLLISSVELSAQGYLVDKGFGFGYSFSCLNVGNANYGLFAAGITLMGTFDIYHGFATVRKKKNESHWILLVFSKEPRYKIVSCSFFFIRKLR